MFTLPVFHRNTSWVEKNRTRMLRPVGTLRANPKWGYFPARIICMKRSYGT
jgi:hypothetical protein